MFSKVKKGGGLCKKYVFVGFCVELISRSEVAKTFIADSFPNGSEASRRGTTHNSHKLQVLVERVASLPDNPCIHGNPNMSSCFRCTVGYPTFRIQTIISVIYSPKDLFLLPIKFGFDGSTTSRQTSPFQPTTFSFIQHNICWESVILDERRKTAFTNFPLYQRDVLGWGDMKKRRFLKQIYFIRPSKSATFHSWICRLFNGGCDPFSWECAVSPGILFR